MDTLLQAGVFFFDATARSHCSAGKERATLELLSHGTLRDLAGYRATHGEPHPAVLEKLKLLTLASVAARSVGSSLPYAALMAELELPSPAEVEALVVRGLYAGLVEVSAPHGHGARLHTTRVGIPLRHPLPPLPRPAAPLPTPFPPPPTPPKHRAPLTSARRRST